MRTRMTAERLWTRLYYSWSPQCIICLVSSFCVLHQCSFTVAADCDDVTMYRCSNGLCISRHLVNNSINDCIDNSDEVANPCRFPMYSCRNDRCILMEWVLNGENDCIDGSDEVKLIGTNCTMAATCCFCNEYVPHSDCIDGRCQCISSHYSNQPGTSCIRRRVGSQCKTSFQCSSSIHGPVHCDTSTSSDGRGQCRCLAGYRPRPDRLACVGRRLSEPCRVDSDCRASSTADVACVRGRCACVTGHIAVSYRTCRLRRPGDHCSIDEDCSVAVNKTECVDRQCQCVFDHVWTEDAAECRYDGEDSRQMAVGVTLIVGVVVVGTVDVVLITCLVMNTVMFFALLRRHRLALANYRRTNADA